jgi:hypothetical protein
MSVWRTEGLVLHRSACLETGSANRRVCQQPPVSIGHTGDECAAKPYATWCRPFAVIVNLDGDSVMEKLDVHTYEPDIFDDFFYCHLLREWKIDLWNLNDDVIKSAPRFSDILED